MNWHLDVSPLAEADLAGAIEWYRHIRPGLESDLVLCVEEALDRILDHPETFTTVIPGVRRARVHRFPYNILFRMRDRSIEIVAIYHAKRDPIALRDRIG